jgi:hypothetical protein
MKDLDSSNENDRNRFVSVFERLWNAVINPRRGAMKLIFGKSRSLEETKGWKYNYEGNFLCNWRQN